MTNYIATRHAGARNLAGRGEFAGEDAWVELDDGFLTDLKPGDKVYGTLPVDLIDRVRRKGARYFAFVKEDGKLEDRPYTAPELLARGACFREVSLRLEPARSGSLFARAAASVRIAARLVGARLMRTLQVLRERRTVVNLLAVSVFAISLGLVSEFSAQILAPSDPSPTREMWWQLIGLIVLFFVVSIGLGARLVSKWNDAAKPRVKTDVLVSPGQPDVGERNKLAVLVIGVSKPGVFRRQGGGGEIGFFELLAKCREIATLDDFLLAPTSPASGDHLKINWSNIARLVANNRGCVRRIYLLSDLMLKADDPDFPMTAAEQIPLAVRDFIHSVCRNSSTKGDAVPTPDFFWVSGDGVTALDGTLHGPSRKLERIEIDIVQDAVGCALAHAGSGFSAGRIGVDVTGSTAVYSIGATMAALNRGVCLTHIDERNGYWLRRTNLEAGLFVNELQ